MLTVHIPQTLAGWTVFATGLVLIAYRVRGIDTPRAWVEWLERRFSYPVRLRLLGAALVAVALGLRYALPPSDDILGLLALSCLVLLGLVGVTLLLLQNHARHILIATAESSDTAIRITSIIVTLAGLALTLAPFFL